MSRKTIIKIPAIDDSPDSPDSISKFPDHEMAFDELDTGIENLMRTRQSYLTSWNDDFFTVKRPNKNATTSNLDDDNLSHKRHSSLTSSSLHSLKRLSVYSDYSRHSKISTKSNGSNQLGQSQFNDIDSSEFIAEASSPSVESFHSAPIPRTSYLFIDPKPNRYDSDLKNKDPGNGNNVNLIFEDTSIEIEGNTSDNDKDEDPLISTTTTTTQVNENEKEKDPLLDSALPMNPTKHTAIPQYATEILPSTVLHTRFPYNSDEDNSSFLTVISSGTKKELVPECKITTSIDNNSKNNPSIFSLGGSSDLSLKTNETSHITERLIDVVENSVGGPHSKDKSNNIKPTSPHNLRSPKAELAHSRNSSLTSSPHPIDSKEREKDKNKPLSRSSLSRSRKRLSLVRAIKINRSSTVYSGDDIIIPQSKRESINYIESGNILKFNEDKSDMSNEFKIVPPNDSKLYSQWFFKKIISTTYADPYNDNHICEGQFLTPKLFIPVSIWTTKAYGIKDAEYKINICKYINEEFRNFLTFATSTIESVNINNTEQLIYDELIKLNEKLPPFERIFKAFKVYKIQETEEPTINNPIISDIPISPITTNINDKSNSPVINVCEIEKVENSNKSNLKAYIPKIGHDSNIDGLTRTLSTSHSNSQYKAISKLKSIKSHMRPSLHTHSNNSNINNTNSNNKNDNTNNKNNSKNDNINYKNNNNNNKNNNINNVNNINTINKNLKPDTSIQITPQKSGNQTMEMDSRFVFQVSMKTMLFKKFKNIRIKRQGTGIPTSRSLSKGRNFSNPDLRSHYRLHLHTGSVTHGGLSGSRSSTFIEAGAIGLRDTSGNLHRSSSRRISGLSFFHQTPPNIDDLNAPIPEQPTYLVEKKNYIEVIKDVSEIVDQLIIMIRNNERILFGINLESKPVSEEIQSPNAEEKATNLKKLMEINDELEKVLNFITKVLCRLFLSDIHSLVIMHLDNFKNDLLQYS